MCMLTSVTGSSDATPKTLTQPCEFNSCPTGSPAEGRNASMTRFNYVNSYPVTAMRYGIQTLSPQIFGGAPDIAVAGPNVGANLGSTVLVSGTVGAATEASKEGIPAIAFSGTTGSQTAWTATPALYEQVYAALSTTVTQTLVGSGKPYLPSNIWLNVNFPAVSSSTCSSTRNFKFVLSRINSATSSSDVVTCNNGGRLPTETSVVNTAGCYASISVGVASTKADATAANQKVVLNKLSSILSCLP
jgi:5'/3'-nucleotidase SurE